MTHRADRTLHTAALARVEGEGAMTVRVEDGEVAGVELRIYEPPRFFEALLRGRRFTEPPDITARICGICPVAYQMSACQAIERACGVRVDGALRDLRRLLYCGEWIESHVLHIFLLHAPDYLGYESAIAMAADHKDWVERGLALKKVGNDVVELVGGRAIHPVNVRVGGFYRVPTRQELAPLADRLAWARDAAASVVEWVSGFRIPAFEREYEFVALRHPGEYAVLDGRLTSSAGLDVAIEEFEDHFTEEHVAHSTALHARLDGRRYLTGPLARYAINREFLSPLASRAADDAGLGLVCSNVFQSIIVRAVEVLDACDVALDIIDRYIPPATPAVDVEPVAGEGHAATEAPRGVLFHRYRIDDNGVIEAARIVPPTAQNQAQIEDDLRTFVAPRLELGDDELTLQCEQAIRSYDPCISCATHFLHVEVTGR